MNDTLLLFINGFAGRSSLLDAVMVFVAKDLIYIVFLITLICMGRLVYKKEWKPVIYFFATLAVSYVLLQLMTLLNVDHRPFMDHHLTQLIDHASGKSFPSDHTTISTAIAAGLLFFTRFKKTGALLLVVAAAIGTARIFVGVHYPADIVGGLFTGLAGGAITYMVLRLTSKKSHATISFAKK